MIRTALAFALLLGLTVVAAAADGDEQKPKFGGKFDPEKLKRFQEKFQNLDPAKLKEIQEKLKEKGFDPEKLKEKLKNIDPEKLKALREKFGKGGFGKGGFDPAKARERLQNLSPEQLKRIEDRLKEAGIDEAKIKQILEKLGQKR